MLTILFRLFTAFLRVGAAAFGGGYAVLPLIRETCLAHGWLTPEQFADVAAWAEFTPGPVTLNAASCAGFTAAGIPGALAATVGCVLPSLPIVALLVYVRRKYREHPLFSGVLGGLRSAVCALIFSAFAAQLLSAGFGGASLPEVLTGHASADPAGLLLFGGAFALCRAKTVPPAALILFCGLCGALMV